MPLPQWAPPARGARRGRGPPLSPRGGRCGSLPTSTTRPHRRARLRLLLHLCLVPIIINGRIERESWPLLIQSEETFQSFFITKATGPAVSGNNSRINLTVGSIQPCRARVVELRQGALAHFLLSSGILGNESRRKARSQRRQLFHQFGGIKPTLPLIVQRSCSLGNGLTVSLLLARKRVFSRPQRPGKRERFEAGRAVVGGFMCPRMQHPQEEVIPHADEHVSRRSGGMTSPVGL